MRGALGEIDPLSKVPGKLRRVPFKGSPSYYLEVMNPIDPTTPKQTRKKTRVGIRDERLLLDIY